MTVDLLQNVYGMTLYDNEKNITFWENYLQNLEALDLNSYSEKLTVPILVPIGSRILFRGELKHTNEVTVALGADYFAKCSVHQAEVLRQHRIKDARSKLESLKKEREYLQNQLSFTKQTIYDNTGCDIIEIATEEEDKKWREQHRKNVRQYKQRKNKEEDVCEISNEEIWNKLEELELLEELENELEITKEKKQNTKDLPSSSKASNDKDSHNDDDGGKDKDNKTSNMPKDKPCKSNETKGEQAANEIYSANFVNRMKFCQQPSKLHLFELVLDRHNSLKEMVAQMKARQKRSKTEADLMEKLDDMEKLEELEDEIAILEDMLASDDDDDIEVAEDNDADNNVKKSVAFAEESETFEITFKPSDVEPSDAPYDPQKGITKPSDVHKAFSNYFNVETTSILKKPRCDSSTAESNIIPVKKESDHGEGQEHNVNNTIVIKDVVEKADCSDNTVNQNTRPMSLFKKRRQQFKE